ncbi:MAG: tRNA uridine(34) 5-carboxymethylaminomethyl modification radical SAM/GNAT enzyme Elp3 [Candidatus Dojkabacteria bacterium]|nr:tRNA uridine(34) 5-carboxymethylaminomethyl modification radical SAM/GNAT enzyme Elp3 [Candidatus Dojkabacteria bacterium]
MNTKEKNIFTEISNIKDWDENSLQKILRKYKKKDGRLYRNDELVKAYKNLKIDNRLIAERIRLKPTRTNSGVATVTILTKPFPCPGRCIFCPNDPSMPKSYISCEPGAQRALVSHFDPYAQVYNRLIALKNIGHNIQKVELLVLGGSWSAYNYKSYQIPFITECFRALNDVTENIIEYVQPKDFIPDHSIEDLEEEQIKNEHAYCRNVGLVFETRPDLITEEEIINMRTLGATKVQIGIQTLNDEIIEANSIGRKTKVVKKAIKLLRLAGFKIHGHWMPNLYKSNVQKDIDDYKKLWQKDISPDELKIYPTSIIENTHLYNLYKSKKYLPYTEEELLTVLSNTIPYTPRYCRLSRIIRDIPSGEIVAGNKKTNLRQIAEEKIKKEGIILKDIRSREIKNENISWDNLQLEIIKYRTSTGKEYFISYKTKDTDKICGFLRLSIPNIFNRQFNYIRELRNSSIIREVHVYGKALNIDEKDTHRTQHLGIGKKLLEIAEDITRKNYIKKISVISAIGTREYYKKNGFQKDSLYMHKLLP